MKKNGFIFLIFCFVGLSCTHSTSEKQNISTSIQKPVDLPDIAFTKLTGERFQGKDLVGKNVILILFQPDCDHCQRETKQIREHLQSFSGYQLYFVTNTPVAEVDKFAREYRLFEKPNVAFVLTDVQSILTHFGSIPTPSLYIYNAAGMLVHKFNGETDISVILKAL